MYNRDLVFVRSKVDSDLVVSDSESEDEPDERYNDLKKENEKIISEISEDHKVMLLKNYQNNEFLKIYSHRN